MGLAIRNRPKKSRIIFHHCRQKPNRDLVPANKSKKIKSVPLNGNQSESSQRAELFRCKLDGDLLFEVLKHMDARSLATAACVNRFWHKAAQDEKLWENICTRHWVNTGCGNHQLRSVVLALGGFRRLYSLCLWPLLNPSSPSSFKSQAFPPLISDHASARKPVNPPSWGKDEVHLSLSLFSIHCYEKMSSAHLGNSSGIHVKASKHPIFEDSSQSA